MADLNQADVEIFTAIKKANSLAEAGERVGISDSERELKQLIEVVLDIERKIYSI